MVGARTSSTVELLLPNIERGIDSTLHHQLEHGLRDAIRAGRLAPETVLPSSRRLASELGLARGVVVEAYEQLVAEGYLAAKPGGSTRVARVPASDVEPREALPQAEYQFDFRPGRPDLSEFPRMTWLRSLRRVLNGAPAERLGYPDGRGVPELRNSLARYLNRVRGTSAAPDQVLISTGFAQGLQVAAKALKARGVRRIAVEDPWHPEYREMLMAAGLQIVDVAVDENGIKPGQVAAVRAEAVVVTPAHQYPSGAVLSPERRTALIAWAKRTGGTIIEDDYDSEFRYDREPIGAMQGLCPDNVVFCGTASKVLAPGLRLGWLLAPRGLAQEIADQKLIADHGSAALDQLAFADFIEHGDLDRHLRHMRVVYRRRRDALLESLSRRLPGWRPVGASAGLHVLCWLPAGADEARLVAQAAARGVGLTGVSARRARPGQPGVILGYAAVDERRIDQGVAHLAQALET
jgi:GntR family transcriptional regulator/MocR family aminotransferase